MDPTTRGRLPLSLRPPIDQAPAAMDRAKEAWTLAPLDPLAAPPAPVR